ncbi:hypothetical protein GW17_00049100 [Ensete ventricosum]|nr:hypothetical protein GW17_00049100 [Ensete ventricosum]
MVLSSVPKISIDGANDRGYDAKIIGVIFGLTCPSYQVTEVVVHVVPRLTRGSSWGLIVFFHDDGILANKQVAGGEHRGAGDSGHDIVTTMAFEEERVWRRRQRDNRVANGEDDGGERHARCRRCRWICR